MEGRTCTPHPPCPGESCSTAPSARGPPHWAKGTRDWEGGLGRARSPRPPPMGPAPRAAIRLRFSLGKTACLGKERSCAGSLGATPKTADTESALGKEDGHGGSYSACLSTRNLCPSVRWVCLFMHLARSAFYGELALGNGHRTHRAGALVLRQRTQGLHPAGPSPLQPGETGDTFCVEKKAIVVNFFERWSDFV